MLEAIRTSRFAAAVKKLGYFYVVFGLGFFAGVAFLGISIGLGHICTVN